MEDILLGELIFKWVYLRFAYTCQDGIQIDLFCLPTFNERTTQDGLKNKELIGT